MAAKRPRSRDDLDTGCSPRPAVAAAVAAPGAPVATPPRDRVPVRGTLIVCRATTVSAWVAEAAQAGVSCVVLATPLAFVGVSLATLRSAALVVVPDTVWRVALLEADETEAAVSASCVMLEGGPVAPPWGAGLSPLARASALRWIVRALVPRCDTLHVPWTLLTWARVVVDVVGTCAPDTAAALGRGVHADWVWLVVWRFGALRQALPVDAALLQHYAAVLQLSKAASDDASSGGTEGDAGWGAPGNTGSGTDVGTRGMSQLEALTGASTAAPGSGTDAAAPQQRGSVSALVAGAGRQPQRPRVPPHVYRLLHDHRLVFVGYDADTNSQVHVVSTAVPAGAWDRAASLLPPAPAPPLVHGRGTWTGAAAAVADAAGAVARVSMGLLPGGLQGTLPPMTLETRARCAGHVPRKRVGTLMRLLHCGSAAAGAVPPPAAPTLTDAPTNGRTLMPTDALTPVPLSVPVSVSAPTPFPVREAEALAAAEGPLPPCPVCCDAPATALALCGHALCVTCRTRLTRRTPTSAPACPQCRQVLHSDDWLFIDTGVGGGASGPGAPTPRGSDAAVPLSSKTQELVRTCRALQPGATVLIVVHDNTLARHVHATLQAALRRVHRAEEEAHASTEGVDVVAAWQDADHPGGGALPPQTPLHRARPRALVVTLAALLHGCCVGCAPTDVVLVSPPAPGWTAPAAAAALDVALLRWPVELQCKGIVAALQVAPCNAVVHPPAAARRNGVVLRVLWQPGTLEAELAVTCCSTFERLLEQPRSRSRGSVEGVNV